MVIESTQVVETSQLRDRAAGTPPTESGDMIWTVEEVALYLRLKPETIRSMARRGELPAIKLGKVWRFHKSAIHEMLLKISELNG